MTVEEIRMKAVKMGTPKLANRLQQFAEEKRALKGCIRGNPNNAKRNAYLKRHIRILAQELNSRQMTLKGF